MTRREREEKLREIARRAVDRIRADLDDRDSVDSPFRKISDEIEDEIVDAWQAIIREEIERALP